MADQSGFQPQRRSHRLLAGGQFSAPIMGAILRVKVPPRVDHNERKEVQLRKGDQAWGGSTE
jgi:hypothetical protein